MAARELDIILRLKDAASKELKDVERSFQRFGLNADTALAGAKAGMLALATATAGAATALAASIRHTANVGDELNKTSQKIGMGVEALSGLKYAAELADVTMQSLTTGLRKLAQNASDAAAGTGEALPAFEAMGIAVKDSSGHLKTTDDLLLDVAEKMSQYGDSAQKTALAQKIFGRAGSDLIPLLNAGKSGIAELRAEAEKLGLTWSGPDAQAAEDFNDNLTRLKRSIDGMVLSIGKELLPHADEMVKSMIAWTEANKDWIKSDVSGAVKTLGGALSTLGESLRYVIVLGKTFAYVGESIGKGVYFAGEMQEKFKNFDFAGMVEVWKEAKKEDTESWDKLGESIQRTLDGAKKAAEGVTTAYAKAKGGGGEKKKAAPGLKGKGEDPSPGAGIEDIMRRYEEERKINADFQTQITAQIGTEEQKRTLAAQTAYADRLARYNKELTDREITYQQFDARQTQNAQIYAAERERIQIDVYNKRAAQDVQMEAQIVQLKRQVGEASIFEAFEAEKAIRAQQFTEELTQVGLQEEQKFQIIEKYRLMDIVAEQARTTSKLQMASTFMGNMASISEAIYTLTGEKSQAAFNAYKAFKISETIINTYSAAMGAYNSLSSIPYVGPALGVAAAAAAIGAGMKQVAAIKAERPKAMAEGGIVSRPTNAIIGERGPEAVIPLSRGRAVPVEMSGGGSDRPIQIVNVLDPRLFQPDPDAIINVISMDVARNGVTRQTIKRAVAG